MGLGRQSATSSGIAHCGASLVLKIGLFYLQILSEFEENLTQKDPLLLFKFSLSLMVLGSAWRQNAGLRGGSSNYNKI
jgi:hypothetical protein